MRIGREDHGYETFRVNFRIAAKWKKSRSRACMHSRKRTHKEHVQWGQGGLGKSGISMKPVEYKQAGVSVYNKNHEMRIGQENHG